MTFKYMNVYIYCTKNILKSLHYKTRKVSQTDLRLAILYFKNKMCTNNFVDIPKFTDVPLNFV